MPRFATKKELRAKIKALEAELEWQKGLLAETAAKLEEGYGEDEKNLLDQEELPMCISASNLYNRFRIRELNRQDPRISADIHVWEEKAKNAKKKPSAASISLSAEQIGLAPASRQELLSRVFGLKEGNNNNNNNNNNDDDDKTSRDKRTLYAWFRAGRHLTAHLTNSHVTWAAVSRDKFASPLHELAWEWFEDVYETPRPLDADTIPAFVEISDGQSAFAAANEALDKLRKEDKENKEETTKQQKKKKKQKQQQKQQAQNPPRSGTDVGDDGGKNNKDNRDNSGGKDGSGSDVKSKKRGGSNDGSADGGSPSKKRKAK